jgi:ketosteroid isomerase-like protein
MSKENVDVARGAMEAWNRGDLEAWLATGHPDIEFISSVVAEVEGAERVYRGLAEMRGFWDEWHSVWDATIEISEVRDLGDTVVLLGRMRTRGRASGVPLERPVTYVSEFEGGLIRKLRAYRDAEEALEAVGLRE